MGWGRFLLLGDLGQQLDLQDQRDEVESIRSAMGNQWETDASQDKRIATLEQENRELKLYVYALVRILAAKSALSREDVQKLVDSVDTPDEKPPKE